MEPLGLGVFWIVHGDAACPAATCWALDADAALADAGSSAGAYDDRRRHESRYSPGANPETITHG